MAETKTGATKKTLSNALVKALSELKNPELTGEASFVTKKGNKLSYRYSELPDILNHEREIFAEHGLAVLQDVASENGSVSVKTIILHDSGERMESSFISLPAGDTAQTAGSAITYARRYSLQAFLGIAGENDDDGKAASEAPRERQGPKEASPPPPEASLPQITTINEKQVNLLHIWFRIAKVSDEWKQKVLDSFGVDDWGLIEKAQMDAVKDRLVKDGALDFDDAGIAYDPREDKDAPDESLVR